MSLENWSRQDIDLEKSRSQTELRRSRNKVRMLHHHAFKCRDAVATRDFYENLLNIPLVAVCEEPVDPLTHENKPYLHLYFEVGDGSYLAFFEYPAHFKADDFVEIDQFAHHIALEVDGGDETIDYYKDKLTKAGIDVLEIDHGYCRSIYFYDPNGMRVEFATNVPITERFFADKYETRGEDLAHWVENRSVHFGEPA